MPKQVPIELHLMPNAAYSRVLVDGAEVQGIRRVTVVADAQDVLTVTITSYRLETPYILRGEMTVVYDGPAEASTPARVLECGGCGIRTLLTHSEGWHELPTMTRCPACWAECNRSE